MQVKKQQLELDMEQQTGSKSGKEYVKAVYCHPAYLIYMQSTSCKMLDEAQAGIKIGGRNINNFRYTDDTTPMAEKKRGGGIVIFSSNRRRKPEETKSYREKKNNCGKKKITICPSSLLAGN